MNFQTIKMKEVQLLDDKFLSALKGQFQLTELCVLFSELDLQKRYRNMLELIIRYPAQMCYYYQKDPSKFNITKDQSIANLDPNSKQTISLKHDLCIALHFYKDSKLASLIKSKIFMDPLTKFEIELKVLDKQLNCYCDYKS